MQDSVSKHNNKVVLVDMDSVLADFEERFIEIYTARYPDRRAIPVQNRNTFYITDQYHERYYEDIENIYHSEGFFRSLNPILGALEGIKALEELKNVRVFICTTAPRRNPFAPSEKRQWIAEYLGKEWVNKFILTHDKTLVKGDILIDDRPDINGESLPTWKHILYTQPFNLNIQGMPRMTWENWKEVLLPILEG